MPRIQGAIVVIAGASSGIGRATAQRLAREGARLVLASRRPDTLRTVREECERLGAETIAVPTDVTDPGALRDLAEAALSRFGRIDVWINNAGVGVVGTFEEVPIESHAQVVRINLLGQVNGAHAVLPVFKRQRHGVMINTLSIGSWVPTPFAASYGAAKAGLRGFTESLRGELQDWPGIHVCDLYPAVVDTPGLRHAANHSGHRIDAGGPIASPFEVAETIVSLIRRPRSAAPVGWSAQLLRIAATLAPTPVRWAAGKAMKKGLSSGPRAAPTEGNLFSAPRDHGVYGGFRSEAAIRIPAKAWLAAAGIIGFWLARRR
ncbi:SDR family oxidoreductase [Roseomonas sp. SSH11]|uniref:SDR family oxidoreductase n=1 Tax=Pararoseomonas baculiformis TaxID=2820812 RepID=A0ABS4A965_9PROT|nr:SDR family oxidoreductase [Pararoseomonas baculiformis]MBP0443542.1 SDR family oxidoreductase [Pararoseomonas baculiformis]